MARVLRLSWRQLLLEQRLFWRNPAAAFFGVVLPLIFLALFGAVFAGNRANLDRLVPGVAGMSIAANTFASLAMALPILRDQGVLKRIRGSALPVPAYIAGLVGSAVVNAVVQVVVVIVAGRLFLGTPWPPLPLQLVAMVLLGVLCLSAVGIAYAHVIPSAEAASPYMNVVFLPALFISGTFFDPSHTPAFLRNVAEALPLAHIIDGLERTMVSGRPLSTIGSGLLVIGLWTVFGLWFAVRGFRWEGRGS